MASFARKTKMAPKTNAPAITLLLSRCGIDDHEWLEQPGLDIHSASETSAIYVPDDFILAEKITVDGVVPKTIGISVIIHYTWSDVFGKSFIDFASFAGVAEVGDAKANQKRHPLNTSPWFCGLNPIAKGESWSGIAVRAPRDAADD
jgi:hypothetical protein